VKNLLEPLPFRNGVIAKNRLSLAAMTNSQSHEDGTLSDEELRWLAMRASGGFGTVTTCAAHVAKDGQGWTGELGAFDDAHLPGLRRLATTLRDAGARSIVQIFHGGMRANPELTLARTWSASEGEDEKGPRAATEDDLRLVIERFADAAARSHTAGMDGVEIHGAHGYLLTQFLSRVDNRRNDAWGGSLENRARLIREVTRAVRSRVPSSFVVGVRLSPEDFGNAKGLDLDENVQVARWLCDDGVDFVHLSLWNAQRNTAKHPERHALGIFREALPNDVPILVAGGVWTRAEAEKLLELGADGIAIGRAAIVNPDWPKRIADPKWEPKRPPVTADELRERGLSHRFVDYMRRWKDFVVP